MEFSSNLTSSILKGLDYLYNNDVTGLNSLDIKEIAEAPCELRNFNKKGQYSWLKIAMLYGDSSISDYSRFPPKEEDNFYSLLSTAFAKKEDLLNKTKYLVSLFGVPNNNEQIYSCFTSRWGNHEYEEEFMELKSYLVSIGVMPPKFEPDNERKYRCLGMKLAEKLFT